MATASVSSAFTSLAIAPQGMDSPDTVVARAAIVSALVFLVVMVPVYGFSLRVLQRQLRPTRDQPTLELRSLLRTGTKVAVLGAVFTLLPTTFVDTFFGSWILDVGSLVLPFFGEAVTGILVALMLSVVTNYLFPIVIVTFARRELFRDLRTVLSNLSVLTQWEYVGIAAGATVISMIMWITGVVLLFTGSAVQAVLGETTLTLLAQIGLTIPWGLATFYLMVGMYHLMGRNWAGVDAPAGQKLLVDDTRQLTLDGFGTPTDGNGETTVPDSASSIEDRSTTSRTGVGESIPRDSSGDADR